MVKIVNFMLHVFFTTHTKMVKIVKKQNKPTMRYHFTPIRMGIIKKSDKNKFGWRCGETGPSYISGGNVKWSSCFGKVWQFLKKINKEFLFNPAIPFLGIHQEELKYMSTQKLVHDVHNSIIHDSQKVETIQMSINWWMNKMWQVYSYSGIFDN